MKKDIKNFKIQRLLKQHELYLFVVIVMYSLFITYLNPNFMSLENLFDLGKSSAVMGIMAIGVFVVLLSGGIDISFTAVAISGQYIAANFLIASGIDNIMLAFLISCSVGVVLGAINGFLISKFNIPTLIATLGTSSVFHGALLTIVGTKAINSAQLPDCFKAFGSFDVFTLTKPNGVYYGLSIFVIVFIIIAILTWLILKYTMLGRGIYAIGGDINSAIRSAFNIPKIQFFIYCYVGFLAGIAGVIHISLIRYGNPTYIVGDELSVIAAVVLGGTRITGGTGTIIGTIMGVAMITILNNSLILVGLSSYWHDLFVGLIIIISVSITSYQNKMSVGNIIFRR
ncbi:MAG: ABC transporter permease [Candidatus Atribacteria bacterium]|nr:ABC transporter permease [Candidatus Atribacteria bacterium]